MTIYLGQYLSNALTTRGKKFAIFYNTLTISAVPETDGLLNGNAQEKADTLKILHEIDVAHCPFRHVRIISPDTDVVTIHYYLQLPLLVLFESGSHKINIGVAYEVLEPEKKQRTFGISCFYWL